MAGIHDATEYDVALSFAGEDRSYVEDVANRLTHAGAKVFYDRYEQASLWGEDLYERLTDVYQKKARFTVMFISQHYAAKLWTRLERKAAQARAFTESQGYILPARFDDTDVEGLLPTVGFIDLRHHTPAQLTELICEKLVRAGAALRPPSVPASSAIEPARAPTHVAIAACLQDGEPLDRAEVSLIAQDGTYQTGQTDKTGSISFEISKRSLVSVFCAHAETLSYVLPDFDPRSDLRVRMTQVGGVGSKILFRGHESVAGLVGSLNPIRDHLNRHYLYAKNIAINGGLPQPVPIKMGVPMTLEDSRGSVSQLIFRAVAGDCFLVDYSKRT